jgi:hypothetical protein
MALSFRYKGNVSPHLKREIRYFGKWLRERYDFPSPLEIRLVHQDALVDFDGTKCALRWWQNSGGAESVKGEIAVKSFNKNLKNEGPQVAFPTVIAAIGRVVKYYNQAINDLPITEGRATSWGDKILDAYVDDTVPPKP